MRRGGWLGIGRFLFLSSHWIYIFPGSFEAHWVDPGKVEVGVYGPDNGAQSYEDKQHDESDRHRVPTLHAKRCRWLIGHALVQFNDVTVQWRHCYNASVACQQFLGHRVRRRSISVGFWSLWGIDDVDQLRLAKTYALSCNDINNNLRYIYNERPYVL